MRITISLFILAFSLQSFTETLQEIENLAGISLAKRAYGLTGNGVTVVVHDGFDLEEGDKISHGHTVEAIIRALAPGAKIINMTSIYVKTPATDARATPKLTGRYIADKYSPKVVNLSWGPLYVSKFMQSYKTMEIRNLIRELARFGAAVVVSAGNEGELAGTNLSTKEQSEFIDAINNDPKVTGAIVLVGAGDIVSKAKQDDERFVKDLMANYSTLAGTSRNHYVVGGPKYTADSKENDEFDPTKGTSFTAPVVTATLALLAEKFPHATGKMLVQLLLGGATNVRDVFERQDVKESFITRLAKTTNLPKEHWRRLQWYDIFGRGVVNAKASADLGQKIFARKVLFFPKEADLVVYDSDVSYIEEASSIWALFDVWHERANRNLAKATPRGRQKAILIAREYLWPFMKLWPFIETLPFIAVDKYQDIAAIIADSGDFDFAYDVLFEGLYYLDKKNEDKSAFEELISRFTNILSQHFGKAKKDDHLHRALVRFKKRNDDFDPEQKWQLLLDALQNLK